MSAKDFENKRWISGDQKILFRHKATLSLALKEMRVNAVMENRFLIGKLSKFLAKICSSFFALSFVVKLEKES